MLINLNVNPEVRARNIKVCKEKGIIPCASDPSIDNNVCCVGRVISTIDLHYSKQRWTN